jgi:hypothetical protein
MAIGIPTRREGQKHLGQGKQRQQKTNRQRAVALAQGQQGSGHAHARHTGMQAHMAGNEA